MRNILLSAATALLAGTTLVGSALSAELPKGAAHNIVLVHGAFVDQTSWQPVAEILKKKGYNVTLVENPLTSLAADVDATKQALAKQNGKTVLVGHSWGGVVITAAGNSDKVSGLVYVAAFAPDGGESVNDLGKGHPAPAWVQKLAVDSGGFASLPFDVMAKEFAADLSPAEIHLMASKQGPIALRNFDDKVKVAAWHTKPSWFIRAELDHMIDPAAQAGMAQRAGAKLTHVKASHVPMLSRPAEVAAVILDAAAGKR